MYARIAAEAVIDGDERGMDGGLTWSVAIGASILARNGTTVAVKG
jgi:hypothetical protein